MAIGVGLLVLLAVAGAVTVAVVSGVLVQAAGVVVGTYLLRLLRMK